MATETYNPDNLIAGDSAVRTGSVTIISGQTISRGDVLGKITASGKYNLSLNAAVDGSEVANAIAAEDIDASGGDVTNAAIYVKGDFNTNALTFGTAQTAANTYDDLRSAGIFIKSAENNG